MMNEGRDGGREGRAGRAKGGPEKERKRNGIEPKKKKVERK